MNNRDPFNLRNITPTSPIDIFQSGANLLSRSANTLQEQLRQAVDPDRPAERPTPPHANGMSYATSHANSISSNQQHSESTWQHRRAHSENATTVSNKINNYFTPKDNEQLPMYKDKPYNYAPRRKLPFWRRQRLAMFLLGVLALLLYFFGNISSPNTQSKSSSKGFGAGLNFFPSTKSGKAKWGERRDAVREAMRISWEAYENHAWGFDEFHPLSQKGRQMVPNGMGWIIVDALDTLMIMNMTAELSHAREWITTTLNYEKDHDVNTFETTIRMLGGLLSAHYLSTTFPDMAPIRAVAGSSGGEDLYLEKAADLADRLLGAYESPTGIPYASINLKTRKGIPSHDIGGASSTAEAATLQLEMKYLANLTGEKHYWDHVEKIIQVIDDNGMKDGLLPIFISPDKGTFTTSTIRLGSRGDSYYEYLIKQYLQTSKQEPVYLELWNEALLGIRKHLITYSNPSNLTVLGERQSGLERDLTPKMDHLVCFMPGAIALATTGGTTVAEAKKRGEWGPKQDADLELARELMKTCWGMYKFTATGLSPEIAHFNLYDPPIMMEEGRPAPPCPTKLEDDPNAKWRQDYDIHPNDFHNLQRPETVESLFYMWRITGEEMYREWGWQMFESFWKYTALPHGSGFTSLDNVDHIPPGMRDNMESFWMAETLKYMYLLFSPNNLLPLDQIVFNTEAHPFPNFKLGKLFSTGWSRKPRDANGNIIVEEHPENPPPPPPVEVQAEVPPPAEVVPEQQQEKVVQIEEAHREKAPEVEEHQQQQEQHQQQQQV